MQSTDESDSILLGRCDGYASYSDCDDDEGEDLGEEESVAADEDGGGGGEEQRSRTEGGETSVGGEGAGALGTDTLEGEGEGDSSTGQETSHSRTEHGFIFNTGSDTLVRRNSLT